ncbi:MAG: UDP-N-acetylmuramoyl-L-alanyl-D-glutamate--2,6-diaminopimelate ligase [Defluviitaleaceae bacterium]|nr:UDP-N-acetylmuramoyl-L-alanyl-D-glutamate--2,6-diaminopimelate ligase [Defluviitaleaceae bacterium]
MKLSQLFKNIPHKIIRGYDGEITRIVYDSRQACQGALFICLRGAAVDGHRFIGQAILAGAAAILVQDDMENIPTDFLPPSPSESPTPSQSPNQSPTIGIISTPNTRQAMAYISANFYGTAQHSGYATCNFGDLSCQAAQRHEEQLPGVEHRTRLIGVTGTNGKTTTTYFIEEILRRSGRKTGLIGTTGISALGKPMDIKFATSTTPDPPELHEIFAKMHALGVQDIVMEVSSHALALYKMQGLTFDVGVFTNLSQDHLDFHGTMQEYAQAKAVMFLQSRFAVVNIDDDYARQMLEAHGEAPFYTYGLANADFTATNIVCTPTSSAFSLNAAPFALPLGGRFNIYNALAAIAAVTALGVPLEAVREAVSRLSGVPGRIQAVPNTRGLNVFVDYAHSPDGLKNIIPSVGESTKGRVITLFGCGGDRDKIKRPIMGKIAGELSDYCILTSDNPRTENPLEILEQVEQGVKQTPTPYEIIENRRDAIFFAIKMLTPDDALIIAGKGHEDYQEIGKTKYPFDDFKTAVEALTE